MDYPAFKLINLILGLPAVNVRDLIKFCAFLSKSGVTK